VLLVQCTFAATFTSVQDGPWSSSSTWGGSVPTTNDDVVIKHQVTFSGSFSSPTKTNVTIGDWSVHTGKLIISSGATFSVKTITHVAYGTLQIDNTASVTTGSYSQNNQPSNSTVVNGNFTINNSFTQESSFTIGSTGVMNVNGSMTLSSTGTNPGMTVNGKLYVSDKLTNNKILNVYGLVDVTKTYSCDANSQTNIYTGGKLITHEDFNNNASALINIAGGTFQILGSVNNTGSADFSITNGGSLQVTGSFKNTGGASIDVANGSVVISQTLDNQGGAVINVGSEGSLTTTNFDNQTNQVTIDGLMTVTGSLTNKNSGDIHGTGFLDVNPANVSNAGHIDEGLMLQKLYARAGGSWTSTSNWSLTDGGASCSCTPKYNNRAIVGHNYNLTVSSDQTVGTIYLNSGSTVTIDGNASIKTRYKNSLYSAIVVNSGGAFIDSAGTAYGTGGKIKMSMTLAAKKFTYIASPFSVLESNPLPINKANFMYSYSESAADCWADTSMHTQTSAGWASSGLAAATGNGVAYYSHSGGNYQFSGQTKTGDVSTAITKTTHATFSLTKPSPGTVAGTAYDGWNLLGNPYPSPIGAYEFLTANNTLSAVYYWVASGSNKFDGDDSDGDYAVTNLAGSSPSGTSGNIAAFQGFFVKAGSNTTVNFKNSMRNVNSYVLQKKSAPQDDIRRFRVQVRNVATLDANNETLIAFAPEASDTLDFAWDAYKRKGNDRIALFTLLGRDEMGIQSFGALTQDKTVALGLNVGVDGTYRFDINEYSLLPGTYVVLEDREKGTLTDMPINGSYTFEAKRGVYLNRFVLYFHKGSSLAAEDVDNLSQYRIFSTGDAIRIEPTSINQKPVRVQLLTLDGRILHSEESTIESGFELPLDHARIQSQVLIVRILDKQSLLQTEKLWIK
jgi:hypothetical protein